MKKIINYLFVAASALLLFACEKGIPTYSGENNIYFSNSSDTSKVKDSSKITFAYDLPDKKDTTISVRVYVTGPVSDSDRTFIMTIDTTQSAWPDSISTAKKDINFSMLNSPVIKAGQVYTNLRFKLYRSADMVKKTYVIKMMLGPNENFTTDYTWDYTNLSKGTKGQLMLYTITFDDIFARPKYWLDAYFGTFSRKKLYALSAFFEIDITKWNTGISPATLLISYGKVFQRYLNDEAAKGNTIYEDDGITAMKMGASSQ
jgi:hypothetical protein